MLVEYDKRIGETQWRVSDVMRAFARYDESVGEIKNKIRM